MTATTDKRTVQKRFRKQPLVGGQAEIAGIVAAVQAGRCCRFIGPRYHHKSQIMRQACEQIDKELGYTSLYASLWDARITSDAAFYTSLRDLIASKVNRYYRRRLPRQEIRNPAEMTSFLANLPNQLKAHIVLFIDDLEAASPDYFIELLKVLRAAYQSTADAYAWRFLAVVCASHSLARSALGPTSPFENISELVLIGDFSPEETTEFAQQQVAEACPRPTPQAMRRLYELTGGDRTLVSEVCRECCLRGAHQGKRRITPDMVEEACESLVQHGGREALLEGLQQIENDPEVLRDVLRIMREHKVPSNEISLDPAVQPDPLTTSGFVRLENKLFSIKSDLHFRLLEQHFTPERVGRIFLAAGDWEAAIRYLGAEIRSGHQSLAEERARVMLGTVSTMYSVRNKRDAFGYLARGFETAYAQARLRLYDFDKERNALIPIDPRNPAAPVRRSDWILLSAAQQPEVRALRSLQDYWLHPSNTDPSGGDDITLYVPLRPPTADIQGLAAIEGFISRTEYRRKHEQMMEMVGYLRHAARALRNRAEHERLNNNATQRALDLQNLLKWLQRLMNSKGRYQDILEHTLRSAVHALSGQAQMGSIYLYDRTTGLLTIQADTGYPPTMRHTSKFLPGQGVAGYVYRTGRLWNVRDASIDPRYKYLADVPERYQVKSSIGVPLRGRSGMVGVLCLDNMKRTNAFNADSEQLLTLFASEVAPWLENARLVDTLRDLHDTAIELLDWSLPDSQLQLGNVAERLLNSFNLNACAIGLRTSPWQIRWAVQQGLVGLPETSELESLPSRLQNDVLTQGHPCVISNLRDEPDGWREFLQNTKFTTLLALPLRDDQNQHSVMLLASVGEFTPSEEELSLLATFANQLALALENAELYQKAHGELQQKIEDLQQANRRLELLRKQEVQFRNARLATGLLHQINNAVANIPDLVDEIARQWVEGDPIPLRELRLNAMAVSQISRWLHQFVRLGNLTLETVDLPAVIQEARQNVENRRPANVAEPELRMLTAPVQLQADRALMEILFENLLRNAYEAMSTQRPGSVFVEIEIAGPECVIRVIDNGHGIDEAKRARIWEWGFSTKHPERNTHDRGLGLFACKQIVEGHGGSIELEDSRPNEGSTFIVRLPIAGPQRMDKEA